MVPTYLVPSINLMPPGRCAAAGQPPLSKQKHTPMYYIYTHYRYSKMVPTNLVPSINLMPPGQRGGADWAQAQEAEPMVVWESK